MMLMQSRGKFGEEEEKEEVERRERRSRKKRKSERRRKGRCKEAASHDNTFSRFPQVRTSNSITLPR